MEINCKRPFYIIALSQGRKIFHFRVKLILKLKRAAAGGAERDQEEGLVGGEEAGGPAIIQPHLTL